MKILKRLLLLCLCLAMLAGSALANETADYSTEGYDHLYYKLTLPDGRLIFTGCVAKPGNYMDSKARILCLNPDMTVSWDYIDPTEGSCGFGGAGLIKDGTLGVLFDDSPYQTTKECKLMFFTADGQPTGKEIPLDPMKEYRILQSGLLTRDGSGRKSESYAEFADWEGKVLFRWQGSGPVAGNDLIEEEDGLVMIGREPGMLVNAAGKIMKVDWQGNTVWETVVPFLTEENEGVTMSGCRTSDGCYLARLAERGPNAGSPDAKSTEALVKFSPQGRILWISTEGLEDIASEYLFSDAVEYNGKYVIQCEDKERFASLAYPIRYLWFDTDGKALGTTELKILKEDFARLADKKKVEAITGELIPAGNGLWQSLSGWSESSNHEKEMASQDDVFLKIPEL